MGEWVALQDYAQKQGIPEQEVWKRIRAGQLLQRELGGVVYVYGRETTASKALAVPPPSVPMYYAERSMATIMQLHDELMAEKERCVDLHRRLLTREQAYAELEYYVRILEAKMEGRYPEAPRPERLAQVRPIRPVAPVPEPEPEPTAAAASGGSHRSGSAPRPDGWRSW